MNEPVRPAPPSIWSGEFVAVWPEGPASDYTGGDPLRPGDVVIEDGRSYVLDRWEVSERPDEDGKYSVRGIFRAS